MMPSRTQQIGLLLALSAVVIVVLVRGF